MVSVSLTEKGGSGRHVCLLSCLMFVSVWRDLGDKNNNKKILNKVIKSIGLEIKN